MGFLMFYITAPDEKTAKKLGDASVQGRLAACYNLFPMFSSYRWQGQIEQGAEWVLIMKTSVQRREDLTSFIQSHHPYEVPCVIFWNVEANTAYEDWVNIETTPDHLSA